MHGGRRRAGAGFTLIELMVVVLLIGLVVSLAVLSIRSPSPAERLEREAARLHARMDLAREEAVLHARSLGLQVAEGGYRFMQMSEGDWHAPSGDRLLPEHELPEDMFLRADLDGIEIELVDDEEEDDEEEDDDGERRRPHIFFLASGELLPDFTLRLSARDSDVEFTIAPGDEQWLELVEHER